MFDKKQVQKAIKEIDDNLASLNGPRQAHLTLASDVKLVQAVCMEYFEEREGAKGKKDVRTNEPTEHPKSRNKDS
jgi:hypothetical protein